VALSGFNAKPARSGYKKISGNASLYIIFEDKDNTAVKVKDYIDGIYEEGFYRLNFWAKANNNKELIISIAEEDSIQELGSIKLIGDEETRFYEFLFQAEDSAENLIISSVDKSVTDVWLDDVFVNELEVNSIEEMKNLQSTVVGETFWKNISHAQIGGLENNSGDFFSRPDKQLGQIIQLNKEMLSGIVLKIQKKGTGGKGNYQLRIREVDESTRIPADNIFISANIDCNFQPSIQAEIKEKEKINN